MMPLSLADQGIEHTIIKIGGNAEVKKHLADLGFTVGGQVTLVNLLGENVIVNIRGARVALGADMAKKIMV
ncbi:FeoA family protein [Ruminococcus flavefaciens]|jgi:ferrous iron transport protein A|uniref:FeoA family protein n=1 Tax=Ruminococcus flavefaciens TaxID=1265 RepID=UPI00048D3B2E|nr:FeoA family protein [Ruminococcus flavefaciens]